MKYLGAFEEFNPGMNFPSIKEHFCQSPYKGMEKIAEYLDNGRTTYVTTSYPRDVFTGKRIPGERFGVTDGEYSWPSFLSYYVREYNLKLPEEFENKVFNL
ncbi:MAG: hypothetical protein Q4B26_02130 [Eubacteriales bacterium]|nr:hypothetical protein [Eubacteriales bacterium]